MASVYSGAGEGLRGSVTVRGEVQFSLVYNYRLGALEVGVKRCRDLAPIDVKRNRSDPYVKVYNVKHYIYFYKIPNYFFDICIFLFYD